METLKDTFRRDTSKQQALEYLEEFGESFWAETDERVREITTSFEDRVRKVAGAGIDVPTVGEGKLGVEALQATTTAIRTEYADRYQRVVTRRSFRALTR